VCAMPAAAESVCDRNCLVGFVDQYLEAMVKHAPSSLPVAPNVKFTENSATIPLGDGLWVGISEGPTTFKIYAADPVTGQVAFQGVVKEWNRLALLVLRLKVEDQKITEIEHIVARGVRPVTPENLVRPRPGMVTPVPPAQRNSRKDMLRIANSYFDSIEKNDGKVAPFADDCVRLENGEQMTANKQPDPKAYEGNPAGLATALVRALSCTVQMGTGNFTYITRIWPRRLLVVDEEMGLVFTFPMFVHRGHIRVAKIVGVPGVTERPKDVDPSTLLAGEIFKVHGGKLHEIEAVGFLLPYGAKSGWE
jgi:hypothetical protein